MLDIPLIDKIVKLLFVCMPPELILSDEIDETKVPHGRLVELMRCYNREYSDTEAVKVGKRNMIAIRRSFRRHNTAICSQQTIQRKCIFQRQR